MYILYIHQGLLQCIFQRIYQRLASCYVASCEEFSEICSSCVVTLLGVCGIRCSSAHDGIELAFCQSGTTCHDLNKGHSTRIGPRWKKLAVKSLEVSSGAAQIHLDPQFGATRKLHVEYVKVLGAWSLWSGCGFSFGVTGFLVFARETKMCPSCS